MLARVLFVSWYAAASALVSACAGDGVSQLAEMPLPATMPAYGSLVMDSDRNLWVAEYRAPGEFHTGWTVFDDEGRLDVERVELYRLIKTGGD